MDRSKILSEAPSPPALELVKSGALTDDPKYITKKIEYNSLLRLIKKHKIALSNGRGYNIQAIVNTLNIDPKTARRWLETPKIRQAISDEVEFYLEKMQETGADDWRQWAKQVQLASNICEREKSNNSNPINIKIVTTPEGQLISY